MKLNYNVTGAERRTLVDAICTAQNAPVKYLGAPTFAYEIGGFHIDKTGTVTGEDNRTLAAALLEAGFKPISEEYDAQEAPAKPDKANLPRLYTLDTPRGEIFIKEEFASRDEALAAGYGEYFSTALGTIYGYGDDRTFALETSHKAGSWDTTTIKRDFRVQAETKPDNMSIEISLDGFSPEKLDNLTKMVNAKAPLLKAALGTDDLPIRMTDFSLEFPWFSGNLDEAHTSAYVTLVSKLCNAAKQKTRVTAKEKDVDGSPKYAMRCFLLSLGFIGEEYKAARKILLSRLEGNSSWKNVKTANEEVTVDEVSE